MTSLYGFIKVASGDDTKSDLYKDIQSKSIERLEKIYNSWLKDPSNDNKKILLQAIRDAEGVHPLEETSGFGGPFIDSIEDIKEMLSRGNYGRGILQTIETPFTMIYSLGREPIRLAARKLKNDLTTTYKDLDELESEDNEDVIRKAVNERIKDLKINRHDPARTLDDVRGNDFVTTLGSLGSSLMGSVTGVIPGTVRGASLLLNTASDKLNYNGLPRDIYELSQMRISPGLREYIEATDGGKNTYEQVIKQIEDANKKLAN